MAVLRMVDKETEMKNKIKQINKQRTIERDEKYKYVLTRLKRIYNLKRRNSINPKEIPTWESIAHKYGIYYVVEKNKDIIDFNNEEMVYAIFTGQFFREDWEV